MYCGIDCGIAYKVISYVEALISLIFLFLFSVKIENVCFCCIFYFPFSVEIKHNGSSGTLIIPECSAAGFKLVQFSRVQFSSDNAKRTGL